MPTLIVDHSISWLRRRGLHHSTRFCFGKPQINRVHTNFFAIDDRNSKWL